MRTLKPVVAILAALLIAVPSLLLVSAQAATAVPAPDILNVDFADGTPADHAQGITAQTFGTPVIANDAALGKDVATFNGSSDAYSYPVADQWPKMTQGFTFECQFRYNGDTIPAADILGFCGDAYAGGAVVEAYEGGVTFAVEVNGVYQFTQAPIQPGQWYDLVGTWDGTSADLYLDGTLAMSVPAAGTLTIPESGAENFVLGAGANLSNGIRNPAPVSISSAEIWSTALSADQVAALANHTITVTTSGNGTASASASTANAFATVTLTEQPATGYHFTGWTTTPPVTVASDGTFTMPAQDLTATASFAPNTYAVHYDANGGTGTMGDSSLTYDQSATLTPNAFTRDGYLFAGWATTPDGPPVYADGATVSDLTSANGGTVTLYAAWLLPGQHLVRVSSAGHGTATASEWAAAPGDTVTLTPQADTGYHFASWQDISPAGLAIASDGTFTMPDSDVSAQATFTPNTYTVHYDGNGGEGTTDDSTFAYGDTGTLNPNEFERDGYAFAGWSTAPGGPVVYADTAAVSDLTATDGATVTLYAQWQQDAATLGDWPSLEPGFVTSTFYLPGVAVSGTVSQPLAGLWNGTPPTSYTKVSGDSWLSVSSSGVVTGTAPRTVPQHPGAITVSATNGTVTSTILVEVQVRAASDAPQIQAASWNLWDAGSHVTDSLGKDLSIIATQGIDVIAVQDDNGTMARAIADALGWHVLEAGRLGIVSAWPISGQGTVLPTTSAPAAAVTTTVDGRPVRIWDTELDESDYGPANACFNGVTNPSALVSDEESTTRYAQARTIAREMRTDLSRSPAAPVLLLGDLASPSGADWTAATSGSHCGAGAVDWPVPDVFAAAGLTDSFRVANPNPVTDSGNTWSPVITTDSNGKPEPQDRVDYVDFAGRAVHVLEAHALTVGWPSATDVKDNSWTSDHAAAVATLALGSPIAGPAPQAPTVSVARDTIAYQVNNGPTGAAEFLRDVGAEAGQAGPVLAVDLSGVDFNVAGWYTALVTATRDGYTSNPVAVTVRVAPVPQLTLASTTAAFAVGDPIDQAAVLAQLEPVLDVDGDVNVDLSGVNIKAPGSYPVTVTATDTWGFTVTQSATIDVTGPPNTAFPSAENTSTIVR